MRVRPFFWLLLAASCIGVLIFAATVRSHIPATMQVRIDQRPPVSIGFTTLELHLADPQGLPIENAHVFSSADMLNMHMAPPQSSIREVGQGNYKAQIRLYMMGPWKITIGVDAEGFDSLQQTVLVQVE